MNTFVRSILFFLPVLVTATFAQAQLEQFGQSQLLSATSVQLTSSNFYFAKPNEITILVSVMGFVQRPGRYEISKSIDLVNLIALAGGATPDGNMSDVKITRLLDADGRITKEEFHVDLEDIARVKAADLLLAPGDVIQVERTGWSTFRDTFSFVVSAAIITGAVAQVIYATKR